MMSTVLITHFTGVVCFVLVSLFLISMPMSFPESVVVSDLYDLLRELDGWEEISRTRECYRTRVCDENCGPHN